MEVRVRTAMAVVAIGALSGCETKQQVVQQKEDLLAAAGFVAKPADNPTRATMLRHLPPNHFVTRDRNGELTYLYADPIDCNCVYFGDAAAYTKYRQEKFQENIVEEQQETAEDNELAATSFGWGGWGWGPWGY